MGSPPPFDSTLAEREIERLLSSVKLVDWDAPNGSTYSIPVPPTVYPPRQDTTLLAKVLCRGVLRPGLQFFEIGCGSGALSLLAAAHGCAVRACDINPLAVACTRGLLANENFAGEVFEGGPGPLVDGAHNQWGGDRLYDLVVWNLPYLPLPEAGPYLGPMEEAALVDSDHIGLYERFLNMVAGGSLLRKSGSAYLLLSSLKDGKLACEQAWSKGLAARIVETTTFENGEVLLVLQLWHPFADVPVVHVEEVSSTNEMLLDSDKQAGTSVIARHQTSGRGRRGRQWVAHTGAHLASWMIGNARGVQHHPNNQVQTGADIVRLLRYLAGEDSTHIVCLKWPNDVYLCAEESRCWRKAGGLLFEGRSQGRATKLVLGVGVNITRPPVAEHAGLEETGIHVNAASLHSMLHALVASRFEEHGLPVQAEHDRTSVEEELLKGIQFLGSLFYRGQEINVAGVNTDGALVTSEGDVVDEPEDLHWSNI